MNVMIPFQKNVLWVAMIMVLASSLQAQQITPAHNQTLLNAAQGTIVELHGLLSSKFPSIHYQKVVMPGPQYLMSDDPEYIRVPEGIALKEVVQPGAVRLYVYNVNGIKEPQQMDRKITAVIKNLGTAPMHIRMLKYSSQKPSTNYFKIAKQGLADYFTSLPDNRIRSVKPGEAIPIDERLEKNVVKYDELTHGFYEFVIDQPGEINVIQTDLKTSGPEALKRIQTVLPSGKKNAGRGIFGVSNYGIYTDSVIDTRNGPAAIIVADGKTDPWIIGKESTSAGLSKLAGNYGVMYEIEMKWKSTDGKGLALVTWNARAGDNQWCGGMANTMMVSEGKFKEGIIQLPSNALRTKGAPEVILIQVFLPSKNREEQTIRLKYSPPGASCLPTPLLFIPIEME